MKNFERDTSPIRLIHAGDLLVSTGKIVARDPLTSSSVAAFTMQIPLGSYPLMLSIVTVDGNEDVIGAASLHLHEEEPIRWEMALCLGQRLSHLRKRQIFGYYVDSGLGCFLDTESASLLAEWKRKDFTGFYRQLDQERSSLLGSSGDWGTVVLNAETKSNLVFFSTGYGDSCYASYFGYSASEKVVALLTDFFVFGEQMPDEERFNTLYRGQGTNQ